MGSRNYLNHLSSSVVKLMTINKCFLGGNPSLFSFIFSCYVSVSFFTCCVALNPLFFLAIELMAYAFVLGNLVDRC